MANTYKNAKVDLTTTNLTTLYTAPNAKSGVFKSILVSCYFFKEITRSLSILLSKPLKALSPGL